ncbi:DNA-binding response regulator [Paenibacillus hemerocallicola]|uniref:DNA-binding response regulator n=1 Tax=Paenibacillus hemerocallicola TaxID=1172614 RepID=A0A5C4SYY8_9BACL|nr:DNA-binding response regulator [Paenibacillus hemerocallicola]TNJ61896.1 DNA-binding response regulator [Paenibacillus hemerocallicola]
MSFEHDYEVFLKIHLHKYSGEKLRRLKEGHGHAEKLFLQHVWWPAIGHFEHLHPEYEVLDFKDGTRYLDFAYIRPPFQICFEIDGYGPHARDANRHQFADNLMRQNHLTIDGWKVIRFSYDDIQDKPRRCQQMLQQLMGRWFGDGQSPIQLNWKQKEIVRIALRSSVPVTPAEVSSRLGISDRYARDLLHQLVEMDVLLPASGTQRVRSYRLNNTAQPFYL